MSLGRGLDKLQRRVPLIGFPIATIYKFFDDSGTYLAAALSYRALVSVLPLLLLASTVLGFVLDGYPSLQHWLLQSAVADVPIIGHQLQTPSALGGGTALVVGLLGSLYGAGGVGQALQHAGDTMWHVPRNSRPNFFHGRFRSLVVIAIAGLGMLVSEVGIAVLHGFFHHSAATRWLIFVIGLVPATLVLLVAFQGATNRRVSWRKLIPGALLAAVLLGFLQKFSYLYVDRVIRGVSAVNQIFAVILGLLAYLYVAAVIIVLMMEMNVVLADRLWPRALLTPFTDHVQLTEADQRTYTGMARAQRSKGFEVIRVFFDEPPARKPKKSKRAEEDQAEGPPDISDEDTREMR